MSDVLVERPSAQIAVVKINRPEARNALNMSVRRGLAEQFRMLSGDAAVRAIVLTGSREAAAGADIKEMADASTIEIYQRNTHLLWQAIAECPKPVIAAVNGFALGGGCELAMHADIIVAGETATFGQPEVRVGIMPGSGGTQRLTRAVGKFKAMKIVLTGENFSGKEAEAMGLASEVVPDDQVLDRALKLAETIARMPPLAVQQIKEVMLAGQDTSLAAALMLERKAFQILFASADQKEGMKAFIEKRKPSYEGADMLDAKRTDLVLGIVGTGAMGTGIAQIAAAAGIEVRLFDTRAGAAAKARDSVAETYAMLEGKGKMKPAEVKASSARLKPIAALADLKGAHIVIEAIVEEIGAKQALFVELEPIVGDACLLATNTSSLSVTAIAAKCKLPERVGGFHFFNPVPLMKVVEVIDGVLTASWVGDTLMALAKRIGHFPARTKDTPGFIVNHAGRGFGTEALRIVQDGIARFEEVDRIMREAAGFRMGPFELLDLTALDVSHPVMESIYDQYYQEPRYRPSPITRQRLAAGLLGRKTGRGFYTYKDGKPVVPPVPAAPRGVLPPIWISEADPDWHDALVSLVKKLGGKIDTGKPKPNALCLVTPLGEDATTSAIGQELDPERVVAVEMLFGLDKRRTLMTTPVTKPAMRDAAHALFAKDGVPVSVIHDSPGFVAPRIVAQIVNIGCEIAQQRIATPADLDQAVKLGLGYPHGPLEFGEVIGAQRLLIILTELQDITGDPRYRPSVWLRRRALLGVPLTTPEG